MKLVESMTLLQLALWVQNLSERPVIWTDFDHAVRDEYDRRILEQEQAA